MNFGVLANWLLDRREDIVREVQVLEPRWDPTYGAQPPAETTIEVVDFDKLCRAIDDFQVELDRRKPL